VLPGPGQAVMLRNNRSGHAGRLVFSGHKPDAVYNRLGVVWVSDNSGKDWRRTARIPQDSGSVIKAPGGKCPPLQRLPGDTDHADYSVPVPGCRGPGETTMAELADGTIVLNARNQFCDGGNSGPTGNGWRNSGCYRYKTTSTDAGECVVQLVFILKLASLGHARA
jgi:hypothetical protein